MTCELCGKEVKSTIEDYQAELFEYLHYKIAILTRNPFSFRSRGEDVEIYSDIINLLRLFNKRVLNITKNNTKDFDD